MIGLILAAGKGSRLKQLTSETPKSLLELAENYTMLDYNIDILKSLGIDNIKIVTGFSYLKIEEKLAGLNGISTDTIYNPFWDQCNVLGSLFMSLPYISDDFLFLHADTLVSKKVWETLLHAPGRIVLPFQSKACGKEEMKVIHDDKGKLIKISKEIPSDLAEGEFLGIAKFSADTVPFLMDVSKELFSEGKLDHYMEAAVQVAIDQKMEITTFDIGNADFVEVDFEEDYQHAREIFGK